jgi:hypothetical protein
MYKGITALLAVVAILGFAPLAQAVMIDFEAPAYTFDDINGQGGWTSNPDLTGTAYSGQVWDIPSALFDTASPSAGLQTLRLLTNNPANEYTRSVAGNFSAVTPFNLLIGYQSAPNPGTYGWDTEVNLVANGHTFVQFALTQNGMSLWDSYISANTDVKGTHAWQVTGSIDFGTQTYSVTATDLLSSTVITGSSGFGFATTVDQANAGGSLDVLNGAATTITTAFKYKWVDNVQVGSAEVPEPSSMALAASGLIGLLCYAWRKRK